MGINTTIIPQKIDFSEVVDEQTIIWDSINEKLKANIDGKRIIVKDGVVTINNNAYVHYFYMYSTSSTSTSYVTFYSTTLTETQANSYGYVVFEGIANCNATGYFRILVGGEERGNNSIIKIEGTGKPLTLIAPIYPNDAGKTIEIQYKTTNSNYSVSVYNRTVRFI